MMYIIANWKMNPKTVKEAEALFEQVKIGVKGVKDAKVVVCPPFIWLSKFKPVSCLTLGAQNCHWENPPAGGGAYTGEISANMLIDLGVEYVIVGHSERRKYLGETDEIVNSKIKTAIKAGLKPIFCVGEKAGEEMNLAVEGQLTKGLAGLSVKQMGEIVITYEPVWAISTQGGRPCLPDDALSANLFIRRILTKLYSRFLAEKIPVIYGGSVNSQNAADYIKKANMNGLLVGGASLNGEEFGKIIQSI